MPRWLDQGVAKASLMATDTAQTTPFELTNGLPSNSPDSLLTKLCRCCLRCRHFSTAHTHFLSVGNRYAIRIPTPVLLGIGDFPSSLPGYHIHQQTAGGWVKHMRSCHLYSGGSEYTYSPSGIPFGSIMRNAGINLTP